MYFAVGGHLFSTNGLQSAANLSTSVAFHWSKQISLGVQLMRRDNPKIPFPGTGGQKTRPMHHIYQWSSPVPLHSKEKSTFKHLFGTSASHK